MSDKNMNDKNMADKNMTDKNMADKNMAEKRKLTKADLRLARREETEEILAFYRDCMKTEGCAWSEDYPGMDNIMRDLDEDCLFLIRDEKGIVATISIDDDPNVDNLGIWTIPRARELARVGVRADYQNCGVGRMLLTELMAELKRRGYDGVHFLVSQTNPAALACYEKLHFNNLGTLNIYDIEWFCYEKAL